MLKNKPVTAKSVHEPGNKIPPSNIRAAVVIPALNPMTNLVGFVREMLGRGIQQVIVVNDGSNRSFHDIFHQLEELERCTVLTHHVNRGKGRALKTAFAYFIEHFAYLDGVVTADADGQHAIEDIVKVCERLSLEQGSLILGVRNFRDKNVPKRSYMGNLMTSRIFQLLYGYYLNDTQTGLRGIPASELEWLVKTNGERYDYEINMLIKARQRHLGFTTIPIKTLYFNNNSGSYYSTIKDSALIFTRLVSGLILYSGSAVISGFLDILSFFLLNSVFLTALSAPVRIFASTVIARVISSLFNYLMNRKIMFADTGKPANSAVRYYILCISLMMTSYGLVYTVSLLWRVNESIIKLIIDSVLGIVSYQVQLHWVFRSKDRTDQVLPPNVPHRS